MIVTTAQPSDLPEICTLEVLGFPAANRWGEQAWSDELAARDRLILVGRENDTLVAVATFQISDEVADLHRVIVTPGHRGRGLARQLMVAGIDWASAMGARRMLLEVAEDNLAARRLYEKYGFTTIARRPRYYGDGADALVLALELGVVHV